MTIFVTLDLLLVGEPAGMLLEYLKDAGLKGGKMQSKSSTLALLLTEAIESDTDQILMISRTDQANIYFVSKGYAKRKLPFEQQYVNALIEQIRQMESPVFWGRHAGEHFSVRYQILDAPPGECLLMMIQPV